MEDVNKNDNDCRNKWFMFKRRSAKGDSSKNSLLLKLTVESNRCRTVPLWEKIQQLTSARVNAYENELVATLSYSVIDDENRFKIRSTSTNRSEHAGQIINGRQNQKLRTAHLFQIINFDTVLCSSAPNGLENLRSNAPGLNSAEDIGQRALRDHNRNLDSVMKKMRKELSRCRWYWGNLNRASAQNKLTRKENGSFLVRDSQTEQYQFTVSFRSSGITLHCRIDYTNNYWSLSGLTSSAKCGSLIELIENAMKKSEFGIIGFVKQNSSLTPPFPVRLTKPIYRFYEVSSLQHLCRFTIRQYIKSKDIEHLPLPGRLKIYLNEIS